MPAGGCLGEARRMPTHKGPWLLVVDIAVPLALFYGLKALGASDLTALVVGVVPGLIRSAVSGAHSTAISTAGPVRIDVVAVLGNRPRSSASESSPCFQSCDGRGLD